MTIRRVLLCTLFFALCLGTNQAFWGNLFKKRQGPRERKGFYYKVKPGDNFYSLSRRFNVSEERLKKANSIKDNILPIKTIYIPRSTYQVKPDREHEAHPHPNKTVPRARSNPSTKIADKKPQAGSQSQAREKQQASVKHQGTPTKETSVKAEFRWPVLKPKVSEGGSFGAFSHDMRNSGILLDVKSEEKVQASRKGVVSFSGELQGYGKTVILDHQDKFFTIYAHLGKFHQIKKDQKVSLGQTIGYTGISGNAKKPILHFEIRKLNEALDPLDYLPEL